VEGQGGEEKEGEKEKVSWCRKRLARSPEEYNSVPAARENTAVYDAVRSTTRTTLAGRPSVLRDEMRWRRVRPREMEIVM
jgi:hypothetical protein